MRVIIAGILGGIAMFVWTSIAHVATPLGSAGLSQIPNEAAVLSTMHTAIGDKSGLYFFPWVDPKDKDAMKKNAEAMKTNPSGLLLYHPPSIAGDSMTPMLVEEFAKELAMSLIAAWLLSMTMIGAYAMRVAFVTAIGIFGALSTNASYWIWYGFPTNYTLAYMLIEVVAGLAAGLAIAAYLRPKPA
jgi:hypothetical protein